MTFTRPWIALIVAGCCWSRVGFGQTDTSGGAAEPSYSSGAGAASSFGSGVFSPGTGGGALPPPGGTEPAGGSSLFGGGEAGGAGGVPTQSTPSFTMPGFYGQGSQTFVGGAGRLSRPRFETSLSLSIGYDDNIFQTPTGGRGLLQEIAPSVVEPDPGGEPIVERQLVSLGGGLFEERDVIVGYTEPKPGRVDPRFTMIPPEKRQGSLLTRAGFGLQSQISTRRSVFTLDVGGNGTYYWSRDDDPFEMNGTIGANFLYRITPRLQFTAAVNSAYLTQPDLTRANTPGQPTRGDYISTLTRFDLAYRVTPRFSMSGTISYNSLYFLEQFEQPGNYNEYVGGIEARYLWTPRYTVLTEFRHSMIRYPENEPLNSNTSYFLLGTEFTLNRRLLGSLRLGYSVRSFEEGGDSAATPYAETSLTYRTTSRSLVVWTNRFGFEEPGAPTQERLVLRTGVNYVYSFTPRLRGTLAINLLRELASVEGEPNDYIALTWDSTAALNYMLRRDLSVNLSYSFTSVNSNRENVDYYRNRVFLGATYSF